MHSYSRLHLPAHPARLSARSSRSSSTTAEAARIDSADKQRGLTAYSSGSAYGSGSTAQINCMDCSCCSSSTTTTTAEASAEARVDSADTLRIDCADTLLITSQNPDCGLAA